MNVVFDFGGVLFRWQPQEFMQRLLPRLANGDVRGLDASTAGLIGKLR